MPPGIVLEGDAPERDGFTDMVAFDAALPFEIGDGARDPQDAVVAAGGEV